MATIGHTREVSAPPDRVEMLLADVLVELRMIRRAIDQQRRPSHLTRRDRELLAAILPAVAGAIGSELFTARELIEHEAPGVRLVVCGLSARSLGRLLQRAEGVPLDGYMVQRDGVEVGAVLWRIVATA